MNIEQSKQLRFDLNGLHQLNSKLEFPIYFLYSFCFNAYGYALKQGIIKYIKMLDFIGNDACQYEEINICFDHEKKLIYIFESWYDYKNKSTTPEIENLLEAENFVQLCRMNFLKYAALTKENFIHLLLTWEKIIHQKAPFILIYLDDKDWYDSLPFETQEAMEKFVADHTQQEAIKK